MISINGILATFDEFKRIRLLMIDKDYSLKSVIEFAPKKYPTYTVPYIFSKNDVSKNNDSKNDVIGTVFITIPKKNREKVYEKLQGSIGNSVSIRVKKKYYNISNKKGISLIYIDGGV
jgi:ribosomal protein L7Ae-like RNA K-turn-binding protein